MKLYSQRLKESKPQQPLIYNSIPPEFIQQYFYIVEEFFNTLPKPLSEKHRYWEILCRKYCLEKGIPLLGEDSECYDEELMLYLKSSEVSVEDILDIHDTNRVWYYIPNFNGYELSSDNFIRSMKHYKKYPYGMLIQPKKNKKGQIINPFDPIYTLSNNQNERVEIPLSQIIRLVQANPYKITGYPRTTIMTDIASRNQRCFIKNQTPPPQPDKSAHNVKFTIVS